ncbi:hypothetical protein NSK_005021 [Nannochloropsis salina CCMP1776]|nr:hypothetical protein NSK_005021 [Nannochloropsis salina CCMP1776]|eukprot:TFJ83926.1 hypothetical protein NSK_005021 [Nannochloropsis salina CCMP1776]
MVGFPNVGKSSVINVLMGVTPLEHDRVRVAVSSTPGKTKHFQTLPLDPETMLCDCPGLVFPSFVATTADMVCAGVLPINQLREHMAPVELLCRRLPGPLLRRAYGLKERAKDGEETPAWASAKESGGSSSGCETARTFLGDLCGARGYWTQGSGVADVNRAARMVLRDYVEGRLVYSHPPPGLTAEEGRVFEAATRGRGGGKGPALSEGLRRLALGEGRDKEEGGGTAGGKGGGDGSRGGQQGEVEGMGEEGEEEAEEEEEEELTVGEGSRSGKVRVRPTKRWGKKGKKLRNKTPYEDTEGGVGGRAPGGGARVLGRKVVGGGEGGFTRVTMPHYAGRV